MFDVKFFVELVSLAVMAYYLAVGVCELNYWIAFKFGKDRYADIVRSATRIDTFIFNFVGWITFIPEILEFIIQSVLRMLKLISRSIGWGLIFIGSYFKLWGQEDEAEY